MKIHINSLVTLESEKNEKIACREEFLKLQVNYFSSHLRHADAKAAGIIAFTAAITKIVTDRISWAINGETPIFIYFGYLLLFLSLVTILLSICAVFPRFTDKKTISINNSFSWTSVSAALSKNKKDPSHYKEISKKSPDELLEDISESTAYLAWVIRKKYRFIRLSIGFLIPNVLIIAFLWGADVLS